MPSYDCTLQDLTTADCLIHVVDASGLTDASGNLTEAAFAEPPAAEHRGAEVSSSEQRVTSAGVASPSRRGAAGASGAARTSGQEALGSPEAEIAWAATGDLKLARRPEEEGGGRRG